MVAGGQPRICSMETAVSVSLGAAANIVMSRVLVVVVVVVSVGRVVVSLIVRCSDLVVVPTM